MAFFSLLQFSGILRVNSEGKKTEISSTHQSHIMVRHSTREDTPPCFQRPTLPTRPPARQLETVPDSSPVRGGCPEQPQLIYGGPKAKIQGTVCKPETHGQGGGVRDGKIPIKLAPLHGQHRVSPNHHFLRAPWERPWEII